MCLLFLNIKSDGIAKSQHLTMQAQYIVLSGCGKKFLIGFLAIHQI